MDQPENFDSLDVVELVMATEEALSRLPPGPRRYRLINEIQERIDKVEFGDEDDDAFALAGSHHWAPQTSWSSGCRGDTGIEPLSLTA